MSKRTLLISLMAGVIGILPVTVRVSFAQEAKQ